MTEHRKRLVPVLHRGLRDVVVFLLSAARAQQQSGLPVLVPRLLRDRTVALPVPSQHPCASRSVRRALLTSQGNPGSRYRCRRST